MPILRFEDVTSRRVLALDAYWKSKCRGGGIPFRNDIDLIDIGRDVVPYLIIAEIFDDPFRVRYRLCGTAIQDYDEELSSHFIDELTNTSASEKIRITEAYRDVVTNRKPYYSTQQYPSRRTGIPLTANGGIWPLLTDGDRVGQCIAIQDYVPL